MFCQHGAQWHWYGHTLTPSNSPSSTCTNHTQCIGDSRCHALSACYTMTLIQTYMCTLKEHLGRLPPKHGRGYMPWLLTETCVDTMKEHMGIPPPNNWGGSRSWLVNMRHNDLDTDICWHLKQPMGRLTPKEWERIAVMNCQHLGHALSAWGTMALVRTYVDTLKWPKQHMYKPHLMHWG